MRKHSFYAVDVTLGSTNALVCCFRFELDFEGSFLRGEHV